MGRPCINRVGRRYGRLVVLAYAGTVGRRNTVWTCRCDCGVVKDIYTISLHGGTTKSCGCLRVERMTTHGEAARGNGKDRTSKEYRAWISMKVRCCNPASTFYSYYGGRGITICDRWLNSFENFFSDMGVRPQNCTLDRVDTNEGYTASNCRWATWQTQARNKR